MAYLVGIDEAGYGPNLGPLVIAATVWRIDESPDESDLYEVLAPVVVCDPPPKQSASSCVVVTDSKRLYRPGLGLAALEGNWLALWGQIDSPPRQWTEIWSRLAPYEDALHESMPWLGEYELALPCSAKRDVVETLTACLRAILAQRQVGLERIAARVIWPESFNVLVEQFGTKGEALSRISLQLLREVLSQVENEPILAVCDRHGGRTRYGALLQDVCTESLVEVQSEGGSESAYAWGSRQHRIRVCFRTSGERFLPTAAASMTAKYLRELAMLAFNEFWCARVADLRPTAGYPQDARRFKQAIAAVQSELGIEDHVLWRWR